MQIYCDVLISRNTQHANLPSFEPKSTYEVLVVLDVDVDVDVDGDIDVDVVGGSHFRNLLHVDAKVSGSESCEQRVHFSVI